jgi:hypothetical protein
MKTSTNTTTIITERGTEVKMTTTSKRGFEMVKEVSFCDGDNVEIEKGKETNENVTILTINGKDYKGYARILPSQIQKEKGCYAIFSDRVGLSQRTYDILSDLVLATSVDAETDQSWIDYSDCKAKAEKEEIEYYKNYKRVENAMTLNGKTY